MPFVNTRLLAGHPQERKDEIAARDRDHQRSCPAA